MHHFGGMEYKPSERTEARSKLKDGIERWKNQNGCSCLKTTRLVFRQMHNITQKIMLKNILNYSIGLKL